MLARYTPPSSETPRELVIATEQELNGLLAKAAEHSSDRGIPAVELVGSDRSTLVVGQAGQGVVLLWIDPLGDSFHSVGSADTEGTIVFDYSGSYTEVPAEFAVTVELGRAAALAFMTVGTPFVAGLTLEPD